MIRSLSYLDNHFFGLMYLFFRSLILFNSRFRNYTRLRVRLNVFVFDLRFLS
jgi:hypothetical protein